MKSRLMVISNRLPVVIEQVEGQWCSRPGSGGLVTALTPVLRKRGGLWIGWPGTSESAEGLNLDAMLTEAGETAGYDFRAVGLTDAERDGFYYGFSNEIVWPLFHDLHTRCNYDPNYWRAYRSVNQKFAHAVRQNLRGGDYIWVHDYHLMHVAQELREVGVRQMIGFFLHIPFPPPDIFLKLPWRFDVLRALLEYDVLGFQTQAFRRNFTQCIRAVMPGISVRGRGRVLVVRTPQREIDVGVFPISIDFNEFADKAATPEVEQREAEVREEFGDRKVILGVDRLDYTKGIPERMRAFQNALRRFPELRRKTTLVQLVVPSRTAIDEYQGLKNEIEALVGEINGEFTEPGWVPIHYAFRSVDRTNLVALYRMADVMLVTPLRDGMNLVAKEYCACRVQNDGVLILSEFAGAAATMDRYALLVNPHDVEGTAQRILDAVTMDRPEQKQRMRRLRQIVRRNDVFSWVGSCLRGDEDAAEEIAPTGLVEPDLMSVLPPTVRPGSVIPRPVMPAPAQPPG